MTERSMIPATFVIERTYDASPQRVFAAYASAAAKTQWFGSADDLAQGRYELDFREGGRERLAGGPPGGPVFTYEALFWEITPNERIISTYEMLMDGARISVSVATTELKPAGTGTHLVLTEQGAFLDGLDTVDQRKAGTEELLNALGRALVRDSSMAKLS
jgi:uncharacterized protein YndB with AHSA1/START domain